MKGGLEEKIKEILELYFSGVPAWKAIKIIREKKTAEAAKEN